MKAPKLANALMGYPSLLGGGATPGTNAVMPAPSAKPVMPPLPAAPKATPAPPMKVGHEVGALFAIKQAMRMGQTVPTGYQFNLNDEWLKGLNPDIQTQAQAKAKALNDWLSQNSKSVGAGYGQHPEFARAMIALAQLAKQKPQ